MQSIYKELGNVQIVIGAEDLKQAIREVVSEILARHEEERKDVLVRRTDVSRRLHVDNSTLWRWDNEGYLKAVKIGRHVYYKESDVRRMEEGRLG